MKLREPYETLALPPSTWTGSLNFPPAEKIRIQDTTLRDGEQTPGVIFTPGQKLDIAIALSELGVHILDIGFPAVGAAERETLKLIVDAKRNGQIREDLELMVMCRAVRDDIDTTLKVLDENNILPNEVTFFIFTAGSDLHVKYKLGKSLLRKSGHDESEWLDTDIGWYREANKSMFADAIMYAKSRGVEIIEAGNAEDGSRADVSYIIELGHAAMQAGATRQAFPDTVGIATPESISFYINRIKKEFPDIDLVLHFHNDFDLATINTITAMKCGANIPTVTLGGIGERAGNTPLHSLLAALRSLYGITVPGIKYEKIFEATRLASRLSGIPIQPHEPIVGGNVYSHETGIHTAGMVVDPRIYQVIDPSEYGGKIRYVFGKHSGTAIVEHVLKLHEDELRKAGVILDDELIRRVLIEVKRLREQQAAMRRNERLVDNIYERMNQLGVSETDVVQLAKHLGTEPDSSADTFW